MLWTYVGRTSGSHKILFHYLFNFIAYNLKWIRFVTLFVLVLVYVLILVSISDNENEENYIEINFKDK